MEFCNDLGLSKSFRDFFFFFLNDAATTEFSPLPLHDALPIWVLPPVPCMPNIGLVYALSAGADSIRTFDQSASSSSASSMGNDVVTPWPISERSTTTRRSEEHTSELQSQSNLVCRLLLEHKKQ